MSQQLQDRLGVGLCEGPAAEINLEDGVDEAEIVAISVCRNPALRAELTRIDAALATLDEANRPANPQISALAPIGPVTAVATLLVPLESLWQLPSRSEAAARDADVAGEAVLSRALDLVRDARLLHVELGLALTQAQIRAELAEIAAEIARIASIRAEVGEISPLDEGVLVADAQASADDAEVAQAEVGMARARLAAALRLGLAQDQGLQPIFAAEIEAPPPLEALIPIAKAARPDARGAALAISAAAARAGWARSQVLNLSLQAEAYWHQPAGPAQRLGARLELPIFQQRQGERGRVDAEVERAAAQHALIAHTIIMEVSVAHARFEQASRSRHRFEAEIIPPLNTALQAARGSFESGDQPYLVVLDVIRRLGEARLRQAGLVAAQRRALCDLERALGARLQRAAAIASEEARP